MSSNKIFGVLSGLAVSTAIAAVTLLAVATESAAGFRGGGFRTMSMGSRPAMMSRGPRNFVGKGFKSSTKITSNTVSKTTTFARTNGGTKVPPGHDGTGRPPGDHRPPNWHRPPGIGPIGPVIGTGVGTGIAVGTLDPVNAGPSTPQNFSGPQGGGGGGGGGRGGINIPPANEQRFVQDEVVLEFANNSAPQGIAQLLAQHGLIQLDAQSFTLTNSTLIRARILGARSVRATLARLGGEATLRTGQPNYYYEASQSSGASLVDSAGLPKPTPVVATAAARPAAGDPAQYALRKLNLNEAHEFATGDKIVVAVIDSGIDLSHPELQGVVAGSYDALGKREAPNKHGTGVAGAIASHARLMGAAPAARILAIRAFGAYGTSAEATSFAILKGIEYAATHEARVINMSFNGPADPALSRQLAAAHRRGVVLVAASGNLGPNAAPQYPAADPNVIAVSATDANDKMFKASNVGPYIAVAAPGVDILLPAPDRDYQVTSGTSFAAAYVSGVAALILQRAPGLRPDAVRQILERTAKDLGPRGKDPEFGAGLVDAYQAILAVQSNAAAGPQDLPPKLTAQ
jgi:hypothetical protein